MEHWKERFKDLWYKGDGADEELVDLTNFIDQIISERDKEIETLKEKIEQLEDNLYYSNKD